MDTQRQKSLETTLTQIEKQFGKGAIMRLGDDHTMLSQGVISTGSMSVDLALGVGGVPRGRIIEVYGPESGGKTSPLVTYHRRSAKSRGCRRPL